MFTLEAYPSLQSLSSEKVGKYLMVVYVLILCTTHGGVATGVRFWASLFCLGALIMPTLLDRSLFWFVLGFTLSLNLLVNYAFAANHYWLTVYTVALFTIVAYRNEQGVPLSMNLPRALLIIVFGFATLHKILSSYFVSGRLLGDYILGGSSLTSTFSWFFEGHEEAIQAYWDTTSDVASSTMLEGVSMSLSLPGEQFALVCQVIALTIVVAELAMFGVLVFKKAFDHPVMPVLMLGFVWGTFLFRNEYSFFALLCFLFFLSKPQMKLHWRLLVLLSMATFLAFSVGEVVVVF